MPADRVPFETLFPTCCYPVGRLHGWLLLVAVVDFGYALVLTQMCHPRRVAATFLYDDLGCAVRDGQSWMTGGLVGDPQMYLLRLPTERLAVTAKCPD